MRVEIYSWLGREFVALRAEGATALSAAEQARDVFSRFDDVLNEMGLSLGHTVRTRLWAADRDSRDSASQERVRLLSGAARSASSSFIAPGYFESTARVAVELWALRPAAESATKRTVEYDPPIAPPRYVEYDDLVFCSGVTAVLPTLADQVDDILPRIEGSLSDAGLTWQHATKISFLLHRDASLGELRDLFRAGVEDTPAEREYLFVDGYSSPGKLIEIEVTAQRSAGR